MPRQPIISVLGHIDAGKCVAPDTEIQMADGSMIEARELFEKYRDDGQKVASTKEDIYTLDDPLRVFGVDDEARIDECEVEAAWKLEKNRLLEFNLEDGASIQVTPEHPFLVWEEGEFAFREAEEIESSDMVCIPSRIPVKDDSIEDLKRRTLRKIAGDERFIAFVKEEMAERLMQKGVKIQEELLTNHIRSCGHERRFRIQDIAKICESSEIDTLEAYESIESFKQATQKQRGGKTSNRVELPDSMDGFEDMAYAAGLMLGDGSREATKLYNNNETVAREFIESLESSTGTEAALKRKEDQVDEVYVTGGKSLKVFFENLFDFPSERKSQSIRMSDYAHRMPDNVLGNLICGYFDADGYVNDKGAVGITSASKEMILSLKEALRRFGITGYVREGNYYDLFISGEGNLRKFARIGFRHPEKNRKLKENAQKSKKNPVAGSTPVSGDTIREARLELGASHTSFEVDYQKTYEGYSNVSKRYLRRFVETAEEMRGSPELEKDRRQKRKVLEALQSEPRTRSEIYDSEEIDHRRLLNIVLSLESEGLVEKTGEDVLHLTDEGDEMLSSWQKEGSEHLETLKRAARSDVRFVEVESIDEKGGGTVYDFTTEHETFIGDGVVVHNTTLLDNIRESRIVEGESGGITQMIGATEVPLQTLEDTCGDLLDGLETDLTIPGVLFIDTPGHAAFSSLRKRGGSISDIAIVVVDVEDGVQPQTEEAIRILKQSQTPFIVALNKIDRLHGWRSGEEKSFMKALQNQSESVRGKVDEEIYELMGEINEFDLVVDRFDRIDDFQKKVGVVPVSAKTGEGIPELLMTVAGLAQRYLGDRLEVHEGMGRGTVLEVSQEEGMGTTIDVIHYDGVIEKDQTLVYGTPDGVATTDIRAILKPKPLEEIRVDDKYDRVERTEPAGGVKIVGKKLENVVSGAPVRTAHEDGLEEAKREVEEELEAVDFETEEHGIVVKADSLGSLEAIMQEMEKNEIPVQRAEVGDVTKADAIDVEKEDPENRAIFAFNVDYTDQGERAVIDKGVEVFQAQVIYEIIEDYTDWKQELQEKQRQKALEATTRPAEVRVLEDHVFRKSDPAVVGMKVEQGVLKPGTTLMNDSGERIGRVKSVQEQNESLDSAEKGSEVAVSISGATVGRDFEEGEMLYTSLGGDEYRRLKKLGDLITRHEENALERIVDIQDEKNPRWKIE